MIYDQEILDEFKVEAFELLGGAEEDILELEGCSDKELINRIFRAFHTVKGNASMIGYDLFASLAHHAEDALTKVRSGLLIPNKKLVDLLLNVVDTLKTLLNKALSQDSSPYDISGLIAELHALDPDHETQPEKPSPALEKNGDMRILVAEDDFTSREIIRFILSNYGQVSEVENGKEAVDAVRATFETNPPLPYRLICLDIMMPELDGMSAAKQIRAIEREKGILQRDEAAIIMVTALDDPNTVLKSLYKCGATAYLVKPVHRAALEKELRKLMLL